MRDSIEDFLRYREKYHGVSVEADYEQAVVFEKSKGIAGMRKKLAELKSWWTSNKGKALKLP